MSSTPFDGSIAFSDPVAAYLRQRFRVKPGPTNSVNLSNSVISLHTPDSPDSLIFYSVNSVNSVKILYAELAKAYEPRQVEDRLYAKWQDGGYFRANPKSPKPHYSIVMPPPNITGKLTLGHVLNNTIQDILCRKARMEGREVLWLPAPTTPDSPRKPPSRSTSAIPRRKPDTTSPARNSSRASGSGKRNSAASSRNSSAKSAAPATGPANASPRPRLRPRRPGSLRQLYHEGLIYRGTRMVNWCPAPSRRFPTRKSSPPSKGLSLPRPLRTRRQPGQYLDVATTRPEPSWPTSPSP